VALASALVVVVVVVALIMVTGAAVVVALAVAVTNWRILTSTKKMQFWPSTHVIDAASFIKIVSNSWPAEVNARSTRYQTLWMDKNSARNHSTTKLV
jgi:hypothetical protein